MYSFFKIRPKVKLEKVSFCNHFPPNFMIFSHVSSAPSIAGCQCQPPYAITVLPNVKYSPFVVSTSV